MSESPELCSSIQVLILGNLDKYQWLPSLNSQRRDIPLVLLPYIVSFTQINKIRDGFGCEEL